MKESEESKADRIVKKLTHGEDKLKQLDNPTKEHKKKFMRFDVVKNKLFKPHGLVDPAYNCPDCFGEGLKGGFDQYNQCSKCQGTGKIRFSLIIN